MSNRTDNTNIKTFLSPFFVIAVGFSVALIFNRIIGAWAFIPVAIVYWSLIAIITKLDIRQLRELFAKSGKKSVLSVVAYLPCLFCIVAFVWGIQCIKIEPVLVLLSIIFMVVNPIMEELYWRKYLSDRLPWSSPLKIAFTTILFSLSHPLMWGVFSVTIRSYVMIIPLITMGIIWGIVYHKTGSLRHCIIAHGIVDMLNLSVWVFLNLFIPPVLG